jgi:hypothetical protein
MFEPGQIVDARSSDNAKHGIRHEFSRPIQAVEGPFGTFPGRPIVSTILRGNNPPLFFERKAF